MWHLIGRGQPLSRDMSAHTAPEHARDTYRTPPHQRDHQLSLLAWNTQSLACTWQETPNGRYRYIMVLMYLSTYIEILRHKR